MKVFAVAGLGFGDEGKGTTVDWLVRRHRATMVVRTNGGPQAAHHVVTDDGRAHCASQLGAGALVPGVRAHLAGTVVVDPPAILAEDEALRALGVDDALARLSIDPRAVVVTPMHALLNRIQEHARGSRRHGSCGRGVGQALLDAERGHMPVLRAGDLADAARVFSTVRAIRIAKLDRLDQLADERGDELTRDPEVQRARAELADPARDQAVSEALRAIVGKVAIAPAKASDLGAVVVLEGAQGILLDRDHGFWPHVTPSSTTWVHANRFLAELGEPGRTPIDLTRVGVVRAYASRHGAGPFPTEDPELTAALPERHNKTDAWQGIFRLGGFDAPLTRYAIAALGIDALVVTHLDRLASLARPPRVCEAYADDVEAQLRALSGDARTAAIRAARPIQREQPAAELLPWLENALGRQVDAVSRGPAARDKHALTPAL